MINMDKKTIVIILIILIVLALFIFISKIPTIIKQYVASKTPANIRIQVVKSNATPIQIIQPILNRVKFIN
mgnify:CR=1 FL=1